MTFVIPIAYDYSALSQDFKLLKLFVLYGVVYLCVAHLFTMIMKAENIDINSLKMKRLGNTKFQEIRKEII